MQAVTWSLLIICCVLSVCPSTLHAFSAPTESPFGRDHTSIVVGKISSRRDKHNPYLQKMASYLAKHLQHYGVSNGTTRFAKDTIHMADFLLHREVDILVDEPFAAVQLQETAGANLVLRGWKRGAPTYQAVYVCRKDAGLTSLQDIVEHVVALGSDGDEVEHLTPLAQYLSLGVKPYWLEFPGDAPPPGVLGYVLQKKEATRLRWVLERKVLAAVFQDSDWNNTELIPNATRAALHVFHKSPPMPRTVVIIGKHVPQPIQDAISTLLTQAHSTPEGREMLEAFQQTTRFDALSQDMVHALQQGRRWYHVLHANQ